MLSVSKYKDYDCLANVLTKKGIIRVKYVGVRRKNAKMAYSAQPFCHAQFLLSSAKDYATVCQTDQISDFFAITQDYDAYVLGAKLLKIANHISANETEDLFNLMLLTLSALANGATANVVECFALSGVLKILGVYNPNLLCASCGKSLAGGAVLDQNSGAFYCPNCGPDNGVAVSKNVLEYLHKCANNNLSTLLFENVSEGVLQKAQNILQKLVDLNM